MEAKIDVSGGFKVKMVKFHEYSSVSIMDANANCQIK